jgi:hypothetical protein
MMLARDENYEQCRLIIKMIINTPIEVYTPLGYKEFVDFGESYDFEEYLFNHIKECLRTNDPVFDFELLEVLIDELDTVLQNYRIFTTWEDRKELIDNEPSLGDYVEKLSLVASKLKLE